MYAIRSYYVNGFSEGSAQHMRKARRTIGAAGLFCPAGGLNEVGLADLCADGDRNAVGHDVEHCRASNGLTHDFFKRFVIRISLDRHENADILEAIASLRVQAENA